jgi:hypothetical protein
MDIVLEYKGSTLALWTGRSRLRLTGHLSTQIRDGKRIVVEILQGRLLSTARAITGFHEYVNQSMAFGADMHSEVFRPVPDQERIPLAARATWLWIS